MAVDVTQIGVVYQALMGNAENTLTEQFDAGYIKGADYATVLSQVMTSAMQLATTATLDQPLKDAQVDLINEQIAASISETAVKEAMKNAQVALISEQISASVSATTRENTDSEKKRALIDEQISASVSETAVKEAMKDAQVLDMKVKDFVMLAESEKDRQLKDAQILLASSQVTYENAKIESLGIHDAIDQADSTANLALKGAQKILIEKQQLTEIAKETLTERQTVGYDDQRRVKKAEVLNNSVGMFGAGGTTVPAGFTEAALAAAAAI